MMTKMTQRTELGSLVGLPTARHARVERGNRFALGSTRSCAWIAVVQAHHAAFRSSSHSSMKAENWFQLRVVGVTSTREPGFGRAPRMHPQGNRYMLIFTGTPRVCLRQPSQEAR
jgi:hypothetical protein